MINYYFVEKKYVKKIHFSKYFVSLLIKQSLTELNMQKKLKLAVFALCYAPLAFAQEVDSLEQTGMLEEAVFTFTEDQLGEDDDMSQTVTILNSNSNVYASEVGFLFSPVRFRYRGFNQRYNDIYINGAPVNDLETGQFRYSNVGGINNMTRKYDAALPFEDNNFSMSAMGGSNNYDFRASHVAAGNKLSLSGANRNYTARAMYTYGSGLNQKGWAVAASIGYRWASRGYVEGTFYNSLSYYFGIEKVLNRSHSLSLSTWGNPTERASQGAATDESYFIANNYQYNPYWGYQNGKRRNSRVINDFAPSALLTWDWNISDDMRLTTSLMGKYSMYKSTKLNYNNADNPQPDYWKNLPSSYFDVWDETDYRNRTEQGLSDFYSAWDYLSQCRANRQINWDRLYLANKNAALQGSDAMYFVQAKHNDNIFGTLSSTLHTQLTNKSLINVGVMLGANKGMHYQTMDDMLGATSYHNINSYALGNYASNSDAVQYDLNTMGADRAGKLIKEGDRFGYDYNLLARRGVLWGNYAENFGLLHYSIAARLNYDDMQREGRMRNGMFPDGSYGKSETAHFLSGGFKFNSNINVAPGSTLMLGIGYEMRAPLITAAFVSPEMNNSFVDNLHNERVFSSEISYQFQNSWLHANINAYYSFLNKVTEWQNFYFDDINSFSYVSMTDIQKGYYGIEAGLAFKISSAFNIKAIGTISDAKYLNNAKVRYMHSTKAIYTDDVVMNKGMREASTPLTAASIILDYHVNGWFLDLKGNYYDRIYLSYSPSYRYQGTLTTMGNVNNDGSYIVPDQAEGKGGFMLDGSIGKTLRLKHGRQLSINLMLTNILNKENICTGGYEQSRSDYTVKDDGTMNNVRAYKFSLNPKKYYAFGFNGMLNLTLRF